MFMSLEVERIADEIAVERARLERVTADGVITPAETAEVVEVAAALQRIYVALQLVVVSILWIMQLFRVPPGLVPNKHLRRRMADIDRLRESEAPAELEHARAA